MEEPVVISYLLGSDIILRALFSSALGLLVVSVVFLLGARSKELSKGEEESRWREFAGLVKEMRWEIIGSVVVLCLLSWLITGLLQWPNLPADAHIQAILKPGSVLEPGTPEPLESATPEATRDPIGPGPFPTLAPTATNTPTATPTGTAIPTDTPTTTPTQTATPTETPTATLTPTFTPTFTPTTEMFHLSFSPCPQEGEGRASFTFPREGEEFRPVARAIQVFVGKKYVGYLIRYARSGEELSRAEEWPTIWSCRGDCVRDLKESGGSTLNIMWDETKLPAQSGVYTLLLQAFYNTIESGRQWCGRQIEVDIVLP